MSEEQIDTEVKNMNDNLGTILYIMLGRIYDLLVLIADSQNKGMPNFQKQFQKT
jgi:hypothetical protein